MKHLLMGSAAVLLFVPQYAGAQSSQPQARTNQQAQAGQQSHASQPQQTQGQQQAQAGKPEAQKCMNDLQAFRQTMQQDGLWLSGYRTGYGWPSYGFGMRGSQTAVPTQAANTSAQVGSTTSNGPWGQVNWTVPPMQQLRTLHSAAIVMAQRGDQQGCETVLSELRDAYGQYGQQLKQAGGDQGRINGYRQQQLANAKPVGQMNRAFRADNITGTDVRNPKDEYLGSIEDVVVDPDSGQISYVILARDGFLGIGEDYVALPWRQLKATQNMDAFVLDATDSQLEKAPKVDLQAFSNQQTYNQRRQEIDQFWQKQNTNRAG